jgi:hypothetical protein
MATGAGLMETFLTKRNTIAVVALLLLWKIYLSATLQLHPDEAYYWLWSKYLDLGYFDHPPLIAYAIRLTTLFSDRELWVRFSGILETLIVSVLAWKLSLRISSDRMIASASVITLNVLPLTLAGSVVITPDIPVFLFVSACIFAYWQIEETGNARYWYLLGTFFGLALLSKYTAVLVAPSLFLFILFTNERKWLGTIHPYAAFLAGCALFLPVFYWNSRHQWASFAFQFRHGMGGEGYSPGKLLTFFGGQMAVAGPMVFLAGIYAAIRVLFRKNKGMLFLSLTSLPVLLFFAYSSLKRTAAPNWPCCAYFTFSLLVAHYFLDGTKRKQRFWAVAVLLSLVLSLTAGLQTRFGVIPWERISKDLREADATNWFYGWRELAEDLEKDPHAVVAYTDTSQMAAEITYYTQGRIIGYVDSRHFGGGQYEYWDLPDTLRGHSGVCISYRTGTNALPCATYFASVGKPVHLTIMRDGFPIRTYIIVHGKGDGSTPGWPDRRSESRLSTKTAERTSSGAGISLMNRPERAFSSAFFVAGRTGASSGTSEARGRRTPRGTLIHPTTTSTTFLPLALAL